MINNMTTFQIIIQILSIAVIPLTILIVKMLIDISSLKITQNNHTETTKQKQQNIRSIFETLTETREDIHTLNTKIEKLITITEFKESNKNGK